MSRIETAAIAVAAVLAAGVIWLPAICLVRRVLRRWRRVHRADLSLLDVIGRRADPPTSRVA